MQNPFLTQYKLIQGSRNTLLDYCGSISTEHFTSEHTSFGRGGSIRNLLVHIANVYEHWIGNNCLQKNIPLTKYEDITSIAAVRKLFRQADLLMESFFKKMEESPEATITYSINDTTAEASLLKLFTHVITHEYHHKGQVLSLSRQLGYVPVDTDVIR